jgi:hypothetical protein
MQLALKGLSESHLSGTSAEDFLLFGDLLGQIRVRLLDIVKAPNNRKSSALVPLRWLSLNPFKASCIRGLYEGNI